MLLRLLARTERYAEQIPRAWQPADFYGFFAECRRESVGRMANAGISYAANPKGGFIACHWQWTPIHPNEPLRLYLQLEDQKLCLKLKVPDEHKAQRKKLWDKAKEALRATQEARRATQEARRAASSADLALTESNYHSGVHTTFAYVADVFGEGPLDRERFAQTIKQAEELLASVASKL